MGDREAELPHEIMERIGFLENCAVALGEDREARRHAHPGTAVSPDHTNLVDARANLVSAIRRALGEPRVSPAQQTVTPGDVLARVRDLIANDAWASGFPTMDLYRTALLATMVLEIELGARPGQPVVSVSPAQPSEEARDTILLDHLEGGRLSVEATATDFRIWHQDRNGEGADELGSGPTLREAIEDAISAEIVDEAGEGGFDRGEPAEPIIDLMAALKASLAKRSVAGSSPAPEEQQEEKTP